MMGPGKGFLGILLLMSNCFGRPLVLGMLLGKGREQEGRGAISLCLVSYAGGLLFGSEETHAYIFLPQLCIEVPD